MSEILVILADGFEDVEAVASIDVLRRGGAHVTVAALHGPDRTATSAHGIPVVADALLSGCMDGTFDAIILPGGGKGTENLLSSAETAEILRRQKAAGRLVCAICAAPAVLAAAGVMQTERFTCYPGMEKAIGRAPERANVVRDGNVITGRGPGAAVEFALAVLASAVSEQAARGVAAGMLLDVPPEGFAP